MPEAGVVGVVAQRRERMEMYSKLVLTVSNVRSHTLTYVRN